MKTILITGSEGLIGKELVELLRVEEPESKIICADLSLGIDLRDYQTCLDWTAGVTDVYSLVGIKGSPKRTEERPVDFFVPLLQFNTNIMEASRVNGVKRFLYTSSIAVLNPGTDKYPSMAKLMGEYQIEAYRIQYPEFGNNCCIVRPANVYGRYDNFKNPFSMVVTSLIRKALTENEITVWGDGSEKREFIHARDVVKGMLMSMKQMPNKPVNLGSGEVHTIAYLAEILSNLSGKKLVYLTAEKRGGSVRTVIEDVSQADIGFKADVSLEDGVKEAYEYAKNVFFNEV